MILCHLEQVAGRSAVELEYALVQNQIFQTAFELLHRNRKVWFKSRRRTSYGTSQVKNASHIPALFRRPPLSKLFANPSQVLTIFESFRISFISFAFCTSLLVFVCIISGMAVLFSFAAIWQSRWATRREIEDFDKKGFPVRTKQCMCSTKEPLDWTGYFVCTIQIGEESSSQSSHSLIIVKLLLFLSNRSTRHAPNQRSYAREQKTLQNEPVNRVL